MSQSPPIPERLQGLPGAELVVKGLADLERRAHTAESLLVSVATQRLSRAGIGFPDGVEIPEEPELQLYALLYEEEPQGAYARYNALIRRLVKFESALELRVSQETRREAPCRDTDVTT